ncbi:tetratricopeptide repeat protein [Candidatus Kuenenia stuttgartensis]|uniref:tetratricopeptide repeat protein n=2 Tax=Candidatus Kuenenia TaxID=380738 RepID=UPI00146C2CA9|nr:tetratricopeptide repeat protein [Candidatus Kuenenia stuttgartiensis]
MVTFTYFLDYSLWGENPSGYHFTNLLFHIANVTVFYFFIKKITRIHSLAFISALLFATHPVITETVNSISYREDILAAFFYLMTFILFLKIDDGLKKKGAFYLCYSGSLTFYALSLFSKEMAVTLPVMLVIYTFFFPSKNNPFKECVKKMKGVYIGYFLVTCCYLIIQFWVFKDVSINLSESGQSIFVMFKVLASYIKLLFLPFDLNADYVILPVLADVVSFSISVVLIIVLIIVLLRIGKGNKLFCFFAVWFFVTLSPVSNIIPLSNIMSERYMYIPLMGFSGAVGVLFWKGVSENIFAKICFGVILIVFAFISISRNVVWHDEFALWHDALAREPDSARAHHNLGVVYNSKGMYEKAEYEYKKTLEIKPNDAGAYYNLGNLYERKELIGDAIAAYEKAIQSNPYHADAYNNIGNIYKKKKQYPAAVKMYEKAIRCNPFDFRYHSNLGLIYLETKNYRESVDAFLKALKIAPDKSSTHNSLGNVLKEMGDFDGAEEAYKTALQLDPADANIHNSLGMLYTNMKQFDKAMREFDTAIRLDPKMASAYNNLGIAYANKGDGEKAAEALNTAVALGFDGADVHNNLACVYMTMGMTDNAIRELDIVLEYDQTDCNAHCNLGIAYLSKKNVDKAISEFEEAIKINADDADFHHYLGNALMEKGRYGEAVDAFARAIEINPENSSVHKALGVVYANYFNNTRKALFHLKETLRLNPNQPMAGEIEAAIVTLSGGSDGMAQKP